MNRIFTPEPPKPVEGEATFGWRYIRQLQPDGTLEYEAVPLRKEDLLYPEEGDCVVQEPIHMRDFKYCSDALETFFVAQPNVVVLSDCRVDFGVEGVRPLGPDILVLFDVRRWQRAGTFRLAEEGGRVVLLLEIASPGTYDIDLSVKFDLYDRVGVERYVIVDRGPRNDQPARLLGYDRTPEGWQPMTPDANGRLSLAPVALLLGIEDDHPWFYDARTGERLSDHTQAVAKVREEAEARKKAERKAKRAETKARKEAEARKKLEAEAKQAADAQAELEKRVRELEKQLRRKGKS